MTNSRTRLTRRAADRLLDRRGPADEPLAHLLAAAAAPGDGDLPGAERAAELFEGAVRQAPASRRKLVSVPAAALSAAAVVLGGGGIAVAASQGALNVPFTGHDNRSDDAPEAPSSTNPGLTRTPTHAPGTPSATHTPSGSPSPSLEGLCNAYQAGAVPRKATNPAFAALSAAAGGSAGVAAYCVDLVGPATSPTIPTQAATPTVPAHPSKPSEAVTPTVPPHPTQAPH